MDANGLRFWMLSQSNDWLTPWRARTAYLAGQGLVDGNGNVQLVQAGGLSDAEPPTWATTVGEGTSDGTITWINQGVDKQQAGLFYCSDKKRLQLRSMRTGEDPVEDFATARGMLDRVPMTQDEFGNYARWDAASGLVMAGGSGPSDAAPPNEVPIYWPRQPLVTDLAMGYDDVLYVAEAGALVMVDQRNRWPNYTLQVDGFSFWRLVPLPQGGVIALDRDHGQIGTVVGQPLSTGPMDVPNPGVMRPCQKNNNPPRLSATYALSQTEYFVALAAMPDADGKLVLLSWEANDASNRNAYIRVFEGLSTIGPRLQLSGVRLPYAIAALGTQKLAVFATGIHEALVYSLANLDPNNLTNAEALVATGDTYILPAANLGPMVHRTSLPPLYANSPGGQPIMLPLLPLSLNSVAATGATNPASPAVIDSGKGQCLWHRLFLEAVFPARCGAIVWLAAADSLGSLIEGSTEWYPHLFGNASLDSIPTAMLSDAATGIWQSEASEVPFAPSLLEEDPVQNRQGLFMALVQRPDKVVRNLKGRYLGVRIALNGDGRISPEIAGMRVYASRFSYVQNYLPQLYREDRFGPDADIAGPSTRKDFLERFVTLFESQLTRIEDRVANAYLLTRSESTPDDALPWLGGWIGVDPSSYPPDRSRTLLKAAPDLYRWRGTVKGITKALDVATGGMCSRGAIVLIEDFRLRHIFATILGANLSITDDPLLPGYSGSSNSFVGDTLFLGDVHAQAELQALFVNDLNLSGGEQAEQELYDALAHRLTVFVHIDAEDVNLKLVERIVEAEKPAHVQAAVMVAKAPLMIGLASLVGVNTYLGSSVKRRTATIDRSDVGRYDVVTHAPSLDPRMENGRAYQEFPSPVARATAPAAVVPGGAIVLDGSGSTAPSGLKIVNYRWTLLNQQ